MSDQTQQVETEVKEKKPRKKKAEKCREIKIIHCLCRYGSNSYNNLLLPTIEDVDWMKVTESEYKLYVEYVKQYNIENLNYVYGSDGYNFKSYFLIEKVNKDELKKRTIVLRATVEKKAKESAERKRKQEAAAKERKKQEEARKKAQQKKREEAEYKRFLKMRVKFEDKAVSDATITDAKEKIVLNVLAVDDASVEKKDPEPKAKRIRRAVSL